MDDQSGAVGPLVEVMQEAIPVTLAGLVGVGLLVLEQVDRDGGLARLLQQLHRDEQLPVMHADLGDRTVDPGLALIPIDGV